MSKQELFAACSKPELAGQWLFISSDAGARCELENHFVVNGAFKLVVHVGDVRYDISGSYVEIVHNNYIAFTWNSPIAKQTLVSLEFRGLPAQRAELTLRHQFLPSQEAGVQLQRYWHTCLDNLDSLVAKSATHMAS